MLLQRLFLVFALLLSTPLLSAQAELILDTAERHIRLQTQGLPGKITITMGKFNASRLPPCSAMEAFSSPGTRLSGKTYVGVRCHGPGIWSVLVPVSIAITGNYVTTLRPLAAGQTLQADDLAVLSGDLSSLPTGIVTEASSAIGKTLRHSLGAGQPLRSDQLLSPLVIRQGQTVRVISQGAGFSVSSEGKAINQAAEGQLVQIRMNSGQTVSGIARADGSVEISF
jgi:flagella basal body P-ring formation protein FlgA